VALHGRLKARSAPKPGVGGGYTAGMKLLPILALACATLLTTNASGQWQWLDKDGRKVFSDRAPPPEVPEKNILRKPGSKSSINEASSTPASAAMPQPSPQLSGVDKTLAEKKKQADAAEASKRQQEEERLARARADNCSRARQAKAALDAGQRATRLNDKGEREFLDEAGVAAESQRLQGVIDENCR